MIIAHRGASGTVPENTELAIHTAIISRADLIEIDVQLTADGHIVLFHDRDLQRLTGRAQRIADLDLATIQQIDVGSWFRPEFNQLRIPTLKQVLAHTTGQSWIVEIKPSDQTHQLESQVLELLDQYAGLGNGYISVRDLQSYDWITNHSSYRVGLMQKHRSPAEFFEMVQDHGIPIIQIRSEGFGTDYQRLTTFPGEAYVYYGNTPEAWDFLRKQPIDGILTNYPAVMRAYYLLHPFDS